MPNHRLSPEGMQLPLGICAVDEDVQRWIDERELKRECALFRQQLLTQLGLKPSTATVRMRYLQAMVRRGARGRWLGSSRTRRR